MDKSRFFLPIPADIMCEHKKTIRHNSPYIQRSYHQHDGFEIYLFLNGNATYYIEQHCANLERGSLFFIRPGELHRVECHSNEPYERISINIRPAILSSLSTACTDLGKCFQGSVDSLDNILLLNHQMVNEFILLSDQLQFYLNSKSGVYGCDVMVNCCLSQILCKMNQLFLNREDTGVVDMMPPFVRHTMEFIDQNLTRNITMADISDHVHHNADYISRSFKKITGLSTQQYLISRESNW